MENGELRIEYREIPVGACPLAFARAGSSEGRDIRVLTGCYRGWEIMNVEL